MNRMREQIRGGRRREGAHRDARNNVGNDARNFKRQERLSILASREILRDLDARVRDAVHSAQKHARVVDISGLTSRCSTSTYVEDPCTAKQLLKTSHKLLCKGAIVQGRVGSRWYMGKVHGMNHDSTLDVAFDDNDYRPSMPSDRVQVLIPHVEKDNDRWVLASEIQKLSVPELQSMAVLNRKSRKELHRISMSTVLLLQCTYARYAVTALIRGWPGQNNQTKTVGDHGGSNSGSFSTTAVLPLFDSIMMKSTVPTRTQSTSTGETKRSSKLAATTSLDEEHLSTSTGSTLAFCRYLRMLSTHECSLSSKRKLMGWSERFGDHCGTFSASGTIYGDSSGGCSTTGTWLDAIRHRVKAMLLHERKTSHPKKMPMTEMLIYECIGNLVQLAWSTQTQSASASNKNSKKHKETSSKSGAVSTIVASTATSSTPLSTRLRHEVSRRIVGRAAPSGYGARPLSRRVSSGLQLSHSLSSSTSSSSSSNSSSPTSSSTSSSSAALTTASPSRLPLRTTRAAWLTASTPTTHLDIPSTTSINALRQARNQMMPISHMTTTAVSTTSGISSSTSSEIMSTIPTANATTAGDVSQMRETMEQQILEARSHASRIDLFRHHGSRRRVGGGSSSSSSSLPPSAVEQAASAHVSNLVSMAALASGSSSSSSIDRTMTESGLRRSGVGGESNHTHQDSNSSSSNSNSDGQMFWSKIVWLHGQDGRENKMLRGPNMLLSCWILDLLLECLEMKNGHIMSENTIWCLKKYLLNHRTLELLLVAVHQCDGNCMPRLLPLLSRFLRILSMNVGTSNNTSSPQNSSRLQRIFLDGGFETQQFSTLAQVTAARYSSEQLSMLRPSSGGVPVYSLYCQRLVELMVDIQRASTCAREEITKRQNSQRRSESNIKSNIKKIQNEIKKEDDDDADDIKEKAIKENLGETKASASTTTTGITAAAATAAAARITTSSRSSALSRKMKWSGLDLGDVLPLCTEMIEIDDTIRTLYSTKRYQSPWYGESINVDITRVVGMMSSKLSIDQNVDGESTIRRSPMNSKDRLELCQRVRQLEWSYELDVEFIDVINQAAKRKQKPCCHVLLEEIMRSGEQGSPKGENSWYADKPLLSKCLQNRDERPWIVIGLQVRLETLRRFNRLLSSILPMIDLRTSSSSMTKSDYDNNLSSTSAGRAATGSSSDYFDWYELHKLGLGDRITMFRTLIFSDVKRSFFNRVLSATMSKASASNDTLHSSHGGTVQLKLNRWLSNVVSTKHNSENSIFMQSFRQLSNLHTQQLSTRARPWHVVFEGEAAEDAGGPFRSSLMFVCDDLISQDSGVKLLVPTRNHQYKVGEQRGKYTLRPGVPLHEAEHFEFLGKLLGVGLRHSISCPLNITSTFWKHLTGEVLTMRDVQLMDENTTAVIRGINHRASTKRATGADSNSGQSNNTYATVQEDTGLSWISTMTDGTQINLSGATPKSTFPRHVITLSKNADKSEMDEDTEDTDENDIAEEDIELYAKRLFDCKVRESTFATSLLLRGLRTVVPVDIFRLFTWEQLEEEICGVATMDVDLLAKNCIFEVGDPAFQAMFWQVLRSYDPRQQAQFLRFCWARDRLPLTDKGFRDQKLRIVEMRRRFAASAPDLALPEAATCSFTLTLPKYSTFQVMRRQLLIAIENCTDYDLDGAARGFNVVQALRAAASQRRGGDLRTSTEVSNDRAIAMINNITD